MVVAEERGKLKLRGGARLHQPEEEPFRQVAVGRARELVFQPYHPPREARGARGLALAARFIGHRSPRGVEGDTPRGVYLDPQVLAPLHVESPTDHRRKRDHERAALAMQPAKEHPGREFSLPRGTARLLYGSTRQAHGPEHTAAGPPGSGPVGVDIGRPARVGSGVMPTTADRTRPKNPHAVALAKLQRPPDPLAVYGDLTIAQRRAHYTWVVSVRHARAGGRPAPKPPPWVRMRAQLLSLGFNERAARIREHDRTIGLAYYTLLEFLEHLPANVQTPIRGNLTAMVRAMYQVALLAGVDEPDESKKTREYYGLVAHRG